MSPADIKELHLGVWRLLLRQCSGLTEALTALRLTFFFFFWWPHSLEEKCSRLISTALLDLREGMLFIFHLSYESN